VLAGEPLDRDRAAWNLASLARAELARGRMQAAIAAAADAVKHSSTVKIRFLAARVLVAAGDVKQAQQIAAGLAAERTAEPRAYAKMITAEAARARGDALQAVNELREANALFDTWIGHFELGRAHLDAGAYVQADAEFDRCIRRRGESVALFLDEEPTAEFLPSVYYYLGRARAGMKAAGSGQAYETYLSIRGASAEDPLVARLRDEQRR
jgi:tetratricopeptide (TPR) repeat protein